MAAPVARTLVALLTLAACSRAIVDDALEVIKLSKDITEEVLSSWDVIGKKFNASGGVELPLLRRREKLVLTRLAQVSRAISKLELTMEKTNAVVLLLAKSAGRGTRLELRLHEMTDLLGRVADRDRVMREYVKQQQFLERRTLEDFATWCVSHDPGALGGLMERIHSLVVPPYNHLLGRGLFGLVLDDLQEEHPDLCDLQLSPHQLIYDMYNTISLTEIKGYAMMQFSWMLLRIYGKGNFTQEATLTRERYGVRSARTATAAREALIMARRGIHRCDPPHHKEGETYAEVTRLLQGYIENEVDMNTERTCRDNCGYYTLAENHGCFTEKYCSNRCRGRILNCQYIDSDMWICPASSNSHRRYEWIEYENGRIMGKHSNCRRGTTKVDSWWRWLFWHCSYCMCLCDDPSYDSDRYFSLWDSTSDVKNNKVVTGVRLVKLGSVFHLQIREGTLGERGSVVPGAWVPVQKFDPTDVGVREGEDFHTLSYEKRAIDLDELDSPDGHILTGVRFSMIGAHLHFEIRSTPFNYTTGRLNPDKSIWKGNDNTDGSEQPRSQLTLYRPDIPTRSSVSLPVDSNHDQYVEFTNTDFEADAAQSTVPFVDIQPVSPLQGSSLISGAGIIHRGSRGSGGFIGVKLFTYDFSKHVKAELPPARFDDDSNNMDFMPVVN